MARPKKSTTTWSQPETPPPPMFAGEKERRLVKQINDELIERVIGQQVVYFSIDIDRSNFHPLYGESIEKTFLPPVRIYALVKWEGQTQSYTANAGIDKATSIEIHFHKKRLTEDQNLFVREGDYVLYGDRYYEIVKLSEPKQLFGQVENKFEVVANCIRAREGIFNPQFSAGTSATIVEITPSSTGSVSSTSTIVSAGSFTSLTATHNAIVYGSTTLGDESTDITRITGSLNITGSLTVNGVLITGIISSVSSSQLINQVTTITGSYTVTSTDFILSLDTNYSGIVVTMPSIASVEQGRIYIMKDISGLADTNSIKVSASVGQTIDGESFIEIDVDYASINLYKTTTGWFVI